MNKTEFLECLRKGVSSQAAKIECLQFFIDNYPVLAENKQTVWAISSGKHWTSLKEITITGGSPDLVNYAFDSLRRRLNYLKKFKIANEDG